MNIRDVTQEMAEQLRPEMVKALASGFTTALGLTGYELEAPAKNLFPVLAPFRNSVTRRRAPIGAPAANWKAITAINPGNANPFPGFGFAGNVIETETANFTAAYQVMALGNTVQLDAQIQAQAFQDLKATAGINTLYALMIAEDKALLGAQNFALQVPGTITLAKATTGGSITYVATTGTNVWVSVAARTMFGYFNGGASQSSTPQTVALTSGETTDKVTASVPAVRGAVCYDWYVGQGTASAASAYYYYGTTTVNTVAITAVPTSDNALSALPELAAQAGYATVSAGDTSANSAAFNGLLASCAGDWLNGALVTHGTGSATPSGAYFLSLDGAAFTAQTGGILEIDEVLLQLWNQARISPTRMLVNAQQHQDVTNALYASGAAYTLFRPDQLAERQGFLGGALLEAYLNKAMNGRPIPIETHPHVPDGTVIMISEQLPYPDNQVSNVFEVETQMEYTQIDYATNRAAGSLGGPRYDFEVRAQEVFKNYFPAGCAVISNVGHGA